MSKRTLQTSAAHRLQDVFLEAISDNVERFAVARLVSIAAVQGLRVSKQDQKRLLARIKARKWNDLQLSGRAAKGVEEITLRWSPADTSDLNARIKKLLDALPELVRSQSEVLAVDMLADIKAEAKSQIATNERILRNFRKRLFRRWKQPLQSLALMIALSREFSETVSTHLQDQKSRKNAYLVTVLTRLHARACQVASEILVLLREGYADGAMARWRTLHEIAVVAMYVQERGELVAQRYLLHHHIESHRAMKLHEDYAHRLGLPPLKARDTRAITKRFDALVARFDRPFKSEFGWAAETSTERPNFRDIEKRVSVDHLRPYYKLASHSVHANPKGILFKLGLSPWYDLLLTGPTDYGLADPGQSTVLSLLHVSSALARVSPTFDSMTFMKLLSKLQEEVDSEFGEVQGEIEAEEASTQERQRTRKRASQKNVERR